jgi:hypothetical protein
MRTSSERTGHFRRSKCSELTDELELDAAVPLERSSRSMTCRSRGELHPCQQLGTIAERGEREENATAPIGELSSGDLEITGWGYRNSCLSPLSAMVEVWRTRNAVARTGRKEEGIEIAAISGLFMLPKRSSPWRIAVAALSARCCTYLFYLWTWNVIDRGVCPYSDHGQALETPRHLVVEIPGG